MRSRCAGLFRDVSGAAAVEFALIVPLMVLLLLGGAFGGQVYSTAARVEKAAMTLGALVSGIGGGQMSRYTFSLYRAMAREVARIDATETVSFRVTQFSLSPEGIVLKEWYIGDTDVQNVFAPPNEAFQRPTVTTYLIVVQARYRTAENTLMPMFSRLAIDNTVTFFARAGYLRLIF